jgi:hypothetical protein
VTRSGGKRSGRTGRACSGLLRTATGPCVAGMVTSKRSSGCRFSIVWMAGFANACETSCDSGAIGGVLARFVIIKSGRMPSLPDRGCSFCCRPLFRSLNSHEGEPSIGERCAGDPPARFGGRGSPTQWAFPTPILNCCSGKPSVAIDVDLNSFPAWLYVALSKGLTRPKWVESGVPKRLENRLENRWSEWIGPGGVGIGIVTFAVFAKFAAIVTGGREAPATAGL